MLFRVFVVGSLLSLWWICGIDPPRRIVERTHTIRTIERVREAAPSQLQIIDVVHGLAGAQVPELLRLAPDEQIARVDNFGFRETSAARATIADTYRQLSAAPVDGSQHGGYIDVDISSPNGMRRAVFLLH